MPDYVHEQGLGFLLCVRNIFQSSSHNMHVYDGPFRGFSIDGQSFLAKMIKNRAI